MSIKRTRTRIPHHGSVRVRSRALALAVVIACVCSLSGDAQSQAPGPSGPGSLPDARVDPGAPRLGRPAGQTDATRASYVERRRLWLLGDALYGREYRGTIAVTNRCASAQRVGVFVYGLPDLTIAPAVTLSAGETARLPYVLAPRQRSSGRTAAIAGEVVIWRPGSGPACPPVRVVHVARGQLRSATPADESAETAALQDAAMRAVCVHWWLRGEPPDAQQVDTLPAAARPGASRADAATCAGVVRPAARNLRERLADAGSTGGAPAPAWLPGAAAIDRMSMSELAAFRTRVVEAEAASKEKKEQ